MFTLRDLIAVEKARPRVTFTGDEVMDVSARMQASRLIRNVLEGSHWSIVVVHPHWSTAVRSESCC